MVKTATLTDALFTTMPMISRLLGRLENNIAIPAILGVLDLSMVFLSEPHIIISIELEGFLFMLLM